MDEHHNFQSTVYLIGPRGSGKTTVGSMLAKKLNLEFTDLDLYLRAKTGHEISAIVRDAGWAEFRRIESLCLRECAGRQGQVIATGGGIVLDPENREFLRNTGLVFWLDSTPETVTSRLSEKLEPGQRPSLTGLDPLAEISQIMAEREPLYAACCHHRLDGNITPEEICACIGQSLP